MSLLRKCDRCSKTVPADNTPAWTTIQVRLSGHDRPVDDDERTSVPVVDAELCPECTRDVRRFVSEPPPRSTFEASK